MRKQPAGAPDLEALEIQPLTQKAIAHLLDGRDLCLPDDHAAAQRRVHRWPFPGAVELWIPDADIGERYELATCINLSADGLGILCDEELPTGITVQIAFHQPEVSFHGRAIVRHTVEREAGYFTGVQFLFD